ncbi:MAG: hypothetical protein SOZ78_04320 [Eubacteriales bacterium]|nr:hypothetical protein [Eubacteriales bacterium]
MLQYEFYRRFGCLSSPIVSEYPKNLCKNIHKELLRMETRENMEVCKNRGEFRRMVFLIIKYLTLFFFGGTAYYAIELLWRGHSHPSMIACGGTCFVLLYLLSFVGNSVKNSAVAPLLPTLRAALGALCITATELAFGIVLNLGLHLNVWDYSAMPLNFMGQICLTFSLLWFLLSLPTIKLCNVMEKYIFAGKARD